MADISKITLPKNGGTYNLKDAEARLHGVYYGECSTAAATQAKAVTISGVTALYEGLSVHVKFTYSNTVASPTLNVNGTGAKNIYRYGTAAPSTSAKTSWQAGAVVSFTYDGTSWMMNDWLNDDTTYSAGTGLSLNGTTINHSNAVTAATAGTSTSTSGSSLDIPYVTYDAQGHITASGVHTHKVIGYGTCTTIGPAKAVTIDGFTPTSGSLVLVRFTRDVPAESTLNVNGSGAVSIYYLGETLINNALFAGDLGIFLYDGTYYHLISNDHDTYDLLQFADFIFDDGSSSLNTTSQSVVGAINELKSQMGGSGVAYGICSTAVGTSAKTVTINGYKLTTGAMAVILFNNNVNTNASLNISSTGATPIVSVQPDGTIGTLQNNVILAGDTVTFIYTGANYQVMSVDRVALAPLANGVSY